MKGKEQRLPDYLGHMVEAIDRIDTYVGAMNKAGFVANTLVGMRRDVQALLDRLAGEQ
ncbi:hypothetical protein [Burkholderia ubonensis]|uniref:hypothetical protein n=1 Tax=Burkholderia ubonensis TaxID=101571 RepID=UPI0005D8A47F|nr:hypothetical protein [Burkholderia ubonensis]AJX13665.1 hypothetical protein BW23_4346 [Burkholderia ubonensis MSMB22]